MTINIRYIQSGDYLIPNLTLPADKTKTLGKYGMLRKSYLKQHQKGLYSLMLLEGRSTTTYMRSTKKHIVSWIGL